MVQSYKQSSYRVWRYFPSALMLASFIVMHALLAPMSLFYHAMPMLLLATLVFVHMQGLPSVHLVFLFAIGVAHDAYTGLPLGVTAALLVIVDVLLKPRAGEYSDEAFLNRYAYIAVWLSVSLLGYFLLVSFLSRELRSLFDLFLIWIITMLTYPLLHLVLHTLTMRLYRRVWVFLPQDYQGYK